MKAHVGYASVPYMPTYIHPWTDVDIMHELKLSIDEIIGCYRRIPDYYLNDAEKQIENLKLLKADSHNPLDIEKIDSFLHELNV